MRSKKPPNDGNTRGRSKKTWVPLNLNHPSPARTLNQSSAPVTAQIPQLAEQSSTKMSHAQSTQWSTVEQNDSNVHKLVLLCNSDKERQREGYVLRDLSEKEILSKVRCSVCNVRRKGKPLFNIRMAQDTKDGPSPAKKTRLEQNASSWVMSNPSEMCWHHPGTILRPNKVWSCCTKHVSQKGCKAKPNHDFGMEGDMKHRANWKYHQTPQQSHPKASHRAAVCIDMEMGQAACSDPELIRITAVDFFTQEVLIDRLVSPKMVNAVQTRTCFFGRDAAREALFRYVGPETVIIAHGGSSDLTALRIIHPHVIDTQILESYYGVKTPGGRSLKNLIKIKKGFDIQMGRGHDSLEDSLACRELVMDFIKIIPDV